MTDLRLVKGPSDKMMECLKRAKEIGNLTPQMFSTNHKLYQLTVMTKQGLVIGCTLKEDGENITFEFNCSLVFGVFKYMPIGYEHSDKALQLAFERTERVAKRTEGLM